MGCLSKPKEAFSRIGIYQNLKIKVMKKKSNQKKAVQKDIYEQVTEFVISELEKGQIIWQQKWSDYGLPKNIVSKKAYRGWNLFFTNLITLTKGYTTPYFITFKQAQQLGGHIKQGEKGIPIVYWASVQDKSKIITHTDDEGQQFLKHPTFRVPKQYIVFNLDQTEGIAIPKVENEPLNDNQRIEKCEQVINDMPNRPIIRHRGSEAYYIPSMDEVTMPLFAIFHTEEAYYCTLFHELAHSTGHSSRLNRKELVEGARFGSETYSKEELTAEMTAAFLCATCDIEKQTIINSVAYIQGWLKALKNDKTLMLKAATQAQAAADYILNIKYEDVATEAQAAIQAA
jgi:antirestriction protein ArdC